MSEFDLIELEAPETRANLDVHQRHLSGPANLPVLELCTGSQESWRHRPTAAEIPGFRVLDETKAASLNWKNQGLYWKETLLLESQGRPQKVAVELQDLPGLMARQGDALPQNFQHAVQWDWHLPDDLHLYGLGQRSGPLERRGTAPVNWTTDEPTGHNRSTDPLYQAHPLLWGVRGDLWWAILFVHTPYSRFDLGQGLAGRMRWLTLGEGLQLQVHVGDSPAAVMASLQQTLTLPEPPPLWALGFHQSRWGYKSALEVRELVNDFRTRELPLDVVHLDIDHMNDHRSFTFHPERFPQPELLMRDFAEQGVRTVALIDPGMKFDPGNNYAPVDEALAGNHLLKSVSGAPFVGFCWPDEAVFPDFCKEDTRRWWAKQAQFYLECGVSGLWIDMNEPAIFDKPFWTGGAKPHPMPLATPAGEADKPLTHTAFRNIYGSQMAKATHGAWSMNPKRPWILTRAAFTGVGAYAWSWMGDNASWWEHLALSLPQLSSMGLVGSPFVGVDIGGFFGECNGELYSAWMEASVIYPFMRSHSALSTGEQHPWSFGQEVEETARTALNLRYRLLPYIYSSAIAQCHPGAAPILRPLFYDYPKVAKFRTLEDQVMFGPNLMAAPFLKRGQAERMVCLPPGEWYDLHSSEVFQGDSAIIVERRHGLVPLFAKAGSVIPMLTTAVLSSKHLPGVSWELRCCPGPARSSTIYWDQGEGHEHRHGHYLKAELQVEDGALKVLSRHLGPTFPAPAANPYWPTPQGWQCRDSGGFDWL